MCPNIRTRITKVNTLSHYSLMNNLGMEFKEWLQTEMDERRMSPSELARLSKVPQPTIFRILSGETKDPRTNTVKRLERVLGVESPPLDVPELSRQGITEYADLISAWALLLPDEQTALLGDIQRRAAHNKAVGEMLAAKPVTEAKPPRHERAFFRPEIGASAV